MAKTDLVGNQVTGFEQEVLDLYHRLKELAPREDIPPCARGNLQDATVALWNVVNDLMLEFDQH